MVLAEGVFHDIFRALLQGTPPGTVYALIALGFVLTYKTSGVFNLAFGAQAYVSAALFFQARNTWHWATPVAVVMAVLVVPVALGLGSMPPGSIHAISWPTTSPGTKGGCS